MGFYARKRKRILEPHQIPKEAVEIEYVAAFSDSILDEPLTPGEVTISNEGMFFIIQCPPLYLSVKDALLSVEEELY